MKTITEYDIQTTLWARNRVLGERFYDLMDSFSMVFDERAGRALGLDKEEYHEQLHYAGLTQEELTKMGEVVIELGEEFVHLGHTLVDFKDESDRVVFNEASQRYEFALQTPEAV